MLNSKNMKINYNNFINRIIKTDSLENQVFGIFMIFMLFIGAAASIGNLLQGLGIFAVLNCILGEILVFVFYVLYRKGKNFKLIFCIVILIISTNQWFVNGGGSSGGIQYFFIINVLISLILLKGKKQIIMTLFTISIIFGLMIYEYLDGRLIVQYRDSLSRLIDVIVSLVMVFVIFSLVIKLIYSEIARSKKKADELLFNILPRKIINDLQETGRTDPVLYKEATVLFADIVNFTKITQKIELNRLIMELNNLYTGYDKITEKYQCERIKTIGDAYLAVCGLPEENENHINNLINAAKEMLSFVQERNMHNDFKFEIRIGLHSGEVIGAVVGIKKYIYDIFGDTVNTASRMETYSEPMKINISEKMYEKIKDKYNCFDRGVFEVKGKGNMRMYFLE